MIRIGDAARRLGVEPWTVRLWDQEFGLTPSRSMGGQRLYGEAELTKLLSIKALLKDEGYTIEGAKKRLAKESTDGAR